MGFTRNEQMGSSEAFLGKTNGTNVLRNIISHVGFLRNFSGENMPRSGTPKMTQIQPKLKVIIHAFGLSRGSSSECHGMPPRDMGGNWKGVMWLGTNIWMLLRTFRENFGFHEK